jgi:chemotaxis protein MotB
LGEVILAGSDQIKKVRGFADQRLPKPDAPLDPANRRISVIVQYLVKKTDDEAETDSRTQTKQQVEVSPHK